MKLENMSEFNFKSSICTSREQSERLLGLGLKKETADMCLSKVNVFCQTFDFMSPHNWTKEQSVSDTWYPAWSLHRLIEMYVERYISCSMNLKDLTYEWIINEIEIHIKEGDFNKEYLENGN